MRDSTWLHTLLTKSLGSNRGKHPSAVCTNFKRGNSGRLKPNSPSACFLCSLVLSMATCCGDSEPPGKKLLLLCMQRFTPTNTLTLSSYRSASQLHSATGSFNLGLTKEESGIVYLLCSKDIGSFFFTIPHTCFPC